MGHRVKDSQDNNLDYVGTGKERGYLEIKDYVVLQKPQEQADRLPPPRTLILDFTLTHTRYDSSHVHTTGQMTHIRRSDDAPELDGALREVARKKISHYRQLYLNRPDPIAFLPDTGKERDAPEIKDYVVLQKPQEQADHHPPPRTLILDFTLTHTRVHMCILPVS